MDPRSALKTDAPGALPTNRREVTNCLLPFTFTAIQLLTFVPDQFGLHAVRPGRSISEGSPSSDSETRTHYYCLDAGD
jgi:hypothetical protein